MTHIETERLLLRDVVPADATERYAGWMNDADVTRYMETRFTRHTIDGLRAYIEGMQRKPDTLFLAIVVRDGNLHIGNIKLGPVDRVHGTADVALMIGDRSAWGRGFAAEAIRAVSEYGFAQMGVRKLTAGCYAGNVGSQRAFEKAGYHVEGHRRAQYVCDGTFEDGVLMARFRFDAERAPA
jgi:[ribosomal protein S5]-alanine N-acetyltransferase